MNSLLIVLPILTLLMFEVGLTVQLRSFKELLKSPRALIIGLLGQCVLLPSLAIGVAMIFELEAYMFLGLLLVSLSPGGSSSNAFTMLARGDVALSVTLTMISSVVTLFTLPPLMQMGVNFVDAQSSYNITLPMGALIAQNLLLVAVPIAAGVILKRTKEKLALKIQKVISRITLPSLVVLVLVFFIQHNDTIATHIASLGSAILVFLLCACLCAIALAKIFRLKEAQKRSIVIEVGMQNAAQSIAIASSPFIFNSPQMATPSIIYALLMNVVLLGYLWLVRTRAK